jgi:hypothetical protein
LLVSGCRYDFVSGVWKSGFDDEVGRAPSSLEGSGRRPMGVGDGWFKRFQRFKSSRGWDYGYGVIEIV